MLIKNLSKSTPCVSKRVLLNDGHFMPLVGLGTYTALDQEVKKTLRMAIEAGYRMFDTAMLYENEVAIGEAIREMIDEGIIRREDIFITTKVWNTYHSQKQVMVSAKKSLENLGLDYVDLLLIHWPTGFKENSGHRPKDSNGKYMYSEIDYTETWLGMEDVLESGLTKSIGVSNFNHKQLERIIEMCEHKPVVNQVECHPYLNQQKLVDFCDEHDIILQAFTPLGRGEINVLSDLALKKIAAAHEKSVAQVAIRFQVQRGVSVIPKSCTKTRIIENMNVFDFTLAEDEMDSLMSLNKNKHVLLKDDMADHPHYPFHEEY